MKHDRFSKCCVPSLKKIELDKYGICPLKKRACFDSIIYLVQI